LGGLMIASASGVLIAWRREAMGGATLVVCGLALSVFAYFSAGHNKAFAILVSGVPFFVTGVLFLLSWWMLKLDDQV
jgi:high-affinity Fe2+/Pb2+ permease